MTGAPYRVVDADALGLRGDGPEERRPLRRDEPAHALSGRGLGARDRQDLAELAPKASRRFAKGTNVDDGGADLVTYETPTRRRGLLGRLDHLAERDPGRRRVCRGSRRMSSIGS